MPATARPGKNAAWEPSKTPNASRTKTTAPELTHPPGPRHPGHQTLFQPSLRIEDDALSIPAGSIKRCSGPKMIIESEAS
eukprot:7635618-Pyramimonas_sp.AAC.1